MHREDIDAHELVLYGVNDSRLYHQSAQPIMQNLRKKIAKGTYNATLALKLWEYHAERAAKAYEREFMNPGDWKRVFPPAVRREAAKEFARQYDEELRGSSRDRRRPRKSASSRRSRVRSRRRVRRSW